MAHWQDERGLTLLELLISTVLLGMLFTAAWSIFGQGFVIWKQGEHRLDMYDSLRISMGRVGREIKYATFISPESDITNLYFLNADGKKVKYYCSSEQLIRGEQGSSGWGYSPVASDIQAMKFTYTTTNGLVIDDSNIANHRLQINWTAGIKMVTLTVTARKQGSRVDPLQSVQKIYLRASP